LSRRYSLLNALIDTGNGWIRYWFRIFLERNTPTGERRRSSRNHCRRRIRYLLCPHSV